jgi:hypothetical protein
MLSQRLKLNEMNIEILDLIEGAQQARGLTVIWVSVRSSFINRQDIKIQY